MSFEQPANGRPPDPDELAALESIRRIIVGPVASEVENLTDEQLAERLPGVIVRGMEQDDELATALQLPVVKAFLHLTRTDPDLVVGALYPVMLPAIRMSVQQSVQSAMKGVNTLASSALSPRVLRWRVQSLISGRPLAEVALSDSLLWRVTQVMVVHRESSLLIGHAVNETLDGVDPDQVAAMLDALSSFAAESFGMDATSSGLDELAIGGRTVWVERSPLLVGALVIEGPAPEDLREDLRSLLAQLHRSGAPWMDGQEELPAAEVEELTGLLRSQTVDRQVSKAPGYLVLGFIVLTTILLVVGWIADGVRTRQAGQRLDEVPGVSLVELEDGWLGWSSVFLVDPLVDDFSGSLQTERFVGWRHSVREIPTLSLDPQIVERRVLQRVPPDVEVEFSDGVVVLRGVVPAATRAGLGALDVLPGVEDVDVTGLDSVERRRAEAELKNWSRQLSYEKYFVVPQLGIETLAELTSTATIAERDIVLVAEIGIDAEGDPARNRQLVQDRIARLQGLATDVGLPFRPILRDVPTEGEGRSVRLTVELP